MKKDLSPDNNPQKRKEQKAPEELDLNEYQAFSKDEEEDDFEILDALEHMEQAGTLDEERARDGDQMIELTLDDDDLILDEEDIETDDSGFHFDEQMGVGLEQELLEQHSGFDFDKSVEFDTGETEFEKEAFVLDLDQEDEQHSFDISLETEAEMEEHDFALPDEDLAFDLNAEDEDVLGFMGTESEAQEEDSEDFEIGLEEEPSLPQFSSEERTDIELETELELEDEGEETDSEEIDFMDFEMGQQDESLDDLENQDETDDTEISYEEPPENITEGIEIAEGFADLESDIDLEDEQLSEHAISDIDFEHEPDEFLGKPVITVGDDRVIDLGDDDLEQDEEFDFSSDSWKQDDIDTTKMFGEAAEEEPQEEEAEVLDSEFDFDTGESVSETSQEEEFISSFDDIDIDLEAEATKVLEEAGEFGQFALIDELPEAEMDSEHDFDLDLEEEEKERQPEPPESFDLAEESSEISSPEVTPQESGEEETFDENFDDDDDETRFEAEFSSEAELEAESEDVQNQVDENLDVAEFLEISLRLSPSQMEEFEEMIGEAKTLQAYLDGLETHKPEIKEKIYQKLRDEYIARQKDIFRAPEFTTLFSDVKEDLQDMLTKQAEFVSTIERLNEELEEITVRHLVGEYDEATLHEKEASQKSEIALWNQKNEKIHQIITRYQDILETEEALNPLRQETAAEEELPAEQPKITPEVESLEEESFEEESFGEETFEEEFAEEEFLQEIEQAEEEQASEEMPELPELEETDEDLLGISEENEFEEDFDFETLTKVAEEFVEETSEEEKDIEEEAPQEHMISCKKCGRQTPASDKFCVHCGAKAR